MWRFLSLGSRVNTAQGAAVVLCAAGISCSMSDDNNLKHITHLLPTALGDVNGAASGSQPSKESLTRLKAWLTSQGADVSRIEFRESQLGSEAGVGVFLADGQKPMQSRRRRWWAPLGKGEEFPIVADFPLSIAITADNILSDSQVGTRYGWLIQRRVVDERQLVECYLAVERARGTNSPLYPWMEALPKTFHSPLCWTDAELGELRGTTLHRATITLRARLADSWRHLQPVLAEVSMHLGGTRKPTLDDLHWAHCVFWSRGQSLPVPNRPGSASQLVAEAGAKVKQMMSVHEGIVPGLDFVNHRSPAPTCWWEVLQLPPTVSETGKLPTTSAQHSDDSNPVNNPLSTAHIRLQLRPQTHIKPGQELHINYGDGKSNEELLLLYGFVRDSRQGQVNETEEQVMVACPVPPPSQWDELMAARMELLTSSGARPQFFLRSSSIKAPPPSSSSSSGGGAGQQAAVEAVADVPQEVMESLEIFTLTPEEVTHRLSELHAQRNARRQGYTDAVVPEPEVTGADLDVEAVSKKLKQRGGLPDEQLAQLATRLGLRMASLTTYVRLLEVRLVEMEGDHQGTCSLEKDLQLLAAHDAAVQQQQGRPAESAAESAPAGLLSYRTWCAVVYRAGQKRVVRAHLVGAKQELQRVIAVLAQVHDVQKDRARAAGLKK